MIVERDADAVTDSMVEVGAGVEIRDSVMVRGARGRSSFAVVEGVGKEVRSRFSCGVVGGGVEGLEGDGEGARITSSLEGAVASRMTGSGVAMTCSATAATAGSTMTGLVTVTGSSLAVSGIGIGAGRMSTFVTVASGTRVSVMIASETMASVVVRSGIVVSGNWTFSSGRVSASMLEVIDSWDGT